MKQKKVGRPQVALEAKLAWQALRPMVALNALARHLDVSAAAVSKWPHVPEDQVDLVAAFTGLSRQELRPDLPPDPWAQLSNSKGTK